MHALHPNHIFVKNINDKERYRKYAEKMIESGFMVIETGQGWHVPAIGLVGTVTKIELFDYKYQPKKKIIEIHLAYKNEAPRITGLRRVSKPGQRLYTPAQKLHPVRQGRGMRILSTSKGLITNGEAHAQNIGGEILCEVW